MIHLIHELHTLFRRALFSEHRDVLKILLFMAKADGAVRKAELDVIAAHCVEITGDHRIIGEMVKELLQSFSNENINTFTRIYNKMRRDQPDKARKVADACMAIVATQKDIHPGEQAAINALKNPLPSLA